MPKPATPARLRAARLDAQGLRDGLPSITAAVRRLGAVQAQDFAAAKWVLGARVHGSVAADVDAAIESREVIRSWPMRGTLHVMPTDELRPLLAVTRARQLQRAATRHRQLELDTEVYHAARKIAERALAGRSLARAELFEEWEAAGIRTAAQRGVHLIWWLALDALVCCGPVEGRGQRFVLLDDWAQSSDAAPDRDETLARLFVAYAAGHGPVTVRDFAWWTGLTLTDARLAHAAAGDAVVAFDDDHVVAADAGWPADRDTATPRTTRRNALAAFDEYYLGYTGRDAVCEPRHAERIVPGGNGVFQPILIGGSGMVEGVWKVTRAKGVASVVLQGFERPINPAEYRAALARWASFRGEQLGPIDSADVDSG